MLMHCMLTTPNGTTWLAADQRARIPHETTHTGFTPHLASNLLSLEIPCISTRLLRSTHERHWFHVHRVTRNPCLQHWRSNGMVCCRCGRTWMEWFRRNSDAALNMLYLVGDVLVCDAATGSTGPGTSTRTHSLWAHNLSNGSTWEISTGVTTQSDELQEWDGFTAFSGNNALYFPAKNNTVGSEIWGYDIVNQTYWLGQQYMPRVGAWDFGR